MRKGRTEIPQRKTRSQWTLAEIKVSDYWLTRNKNKNKIFLDISLHNDTAAVRRVRRVGSFISNIVAKLSCHHLWSQLSIDKLQTPGRHFMQTFTQNQALPSSREKLESHVWSKDNIGQWRPVCLLWGIGKEILMKISSQLLCWNIEILNWNITFLEKLKNLYKNDWG